MRNLVRITLAGSLIFSSFGVFAQDEEAAENRTADRDGHSHSKDPECYLDVTLPRAHDVRHEVEGRDERFGRHGYAPPLTTA